MQQNECTQCLRKEERRSVCPITPRSFARMRRLNLISAEGFRVTGVMVYPDKSGDWVWVTLHRLNSLFLLIVSLPKRSIFAGSSTVLFGVIFWRTEELSGLIWLLNERLRRWCAWRACWFGCKDMAGGVKQATIITHDYFSAQKTRSQSLRSTRASVLVAYFLWYCRRIE